MKFPLWAGFTGTICGLLILTSSGSAREQMVALVASPLVDHPVASRPASRNASSWRLKTGDWGENLAEEMLRLQGYDQVVAVKTTSNNGIDRIAIKRGSAGQVVGVRFVEVKTGRSSEFKLGNTKYSGRQMAHKWLTDRLRAAYRSDDDNVKELARDIRRFVRNSDLPLESLGEIIHVNTSAGEVRRFKADAKTLISSESLERLLVQMRRRSSLPTVQHWAGRSLRHLDQIQTTSMPLWIATAEGPPIRLAFRAAKPRAPTVALRGVALREGRSIGAGRLLTKSAGRVAVAIALAADAKELVDTELAYRRGHISRRDRNIRHVTSAGGITGAWAGASLGSAAGGAIGLAGGPFAWITVPAGALVGGAVGGIGGYFAGSTFASYAASAWYDAIDRDIRDRAERQIIAAGAFR